MAEEERPVRVILVDDEADLRILLWLAIEADGRCQVVGDASNGIEGVSLAASAAPDVVVLDQLMPEMDGITAVPLIREAAPAAKIIMLSALADPVARDRAIDAGADAYVEKSASFQPLLDLAVALARGNAANRN